jgi:isopenicillin-N epimerase
MSLRDAWTIDPAITFLNHGSFGACPREVLAHQAALRAELEREPVAFMARSLEGRMDRAREVLGAFVGADPDDLAWVTNASTGVATVVRSLDFAAGDELLTTTHAYNAVKTTLQHAAERAGATVVAAPVPYPIDGPAAVVEAVLGAVTARTRLLVVDHVTSPTGLVYPVADLVSALAERGVDVLVDGAHAPGMVALDLDALGAAYYSGNCHKWLCAPKGAAFLHVRRDRQAQIHPLVVSHGANVPRTDRSRFRLEFDWTGTWDPSAQLSVPKAIEVVGGLVPGGWDEVRARNHALALEGRELLCAALGLEAPAPGGMLGSLASVPLPRHPELLPEAFVHETPLQARLWTEHGVEVPIFPFPARPDYQLRISAQLYNQRADYERLAAALKAALA